MHRTRGLALAAVVGDSTTLQARAGLAPGARALMLSDSASLARPPTCQGRGPALARAALSSLLQAELRVQWEFQNIILEAAEGPNRIGKQWGGRGHLYES